MAAEARLLASYQEAFDFGVPLPHMPIHAVLHMPKPRDNCLGMGTSFPTAAGKEHAWKWLPYARRSVLVHKVAQG